MALSVGSPRPRLPGAPCPVKSGLSSPITRGRCPADSNENLLHISFVGSGPHCPGRRKISLAEMPHLHLRTSANIVENVDVDDILAALVEELGRHETIRKQDIKAYHNLHTHHRMGEGAPAGFAHLTLSLKSGRSDDMLARLGESLYAVLRSCFAASLQNSELSLTLEIREFPKNRYWKNL